MRPRALPRRLRLALAPALLALPLGLPLAGTASALPAPLPRLVPGAPAVLIGSGRPTDAAPVRATGPRLALRTSASGSRATASSTFVVTYSGFSPTQRDAFQAAVDTWAGLLTSSVPITIDARLDALPPGVLGSASPSTYVVEDGNGRYDAEDTRVPIALANSKAGRDLDPSGPDIDADFSNDTSLFSYGTAADSTKYDFTTVVLHEIAHGLGFAGAMEVVTDSSGAHRGYWDTGTTQPRPLVFDRSAVTLRADGTAAPLLGLGRGSVALGTALTTGRALWDGPAGKAANGGVRPELYTPSTYEEGSSYSHLDEATYPAGDPNSLMTPQIDLGEVIRDPGPIALGILHDLGWKAQTSPLRLTGPITARTGATVAVTGAAPNASTVQLFFKKRGQTTTTPGAEPGFTLQRVLAVGTDGRFATTFVANDDYRYYAQVGTDVSEPVLTQARPTFSGSATRSVPRGGTVTLTGRGLPGTRLTLTYARTTGSSVVRVVTVASDGTWRRSQALAEDLQVSAAGANGQRSETTVLLQTR